MVDVWFKAFEVKTINVHELDAAQCVPYTATNDKSYAETCIGYLSGVNPDSATQSQIKRPAVQLQHLYEYLVFEAKNNVTINFKAYRAGPHRAECKNYDKFFFALKRKLVRS